MSPLVLACSWEAIRGRVTGSMAPLVFTWEVTRGGVIGSVAPLVLAWKATRREGDWGHGSTEFGLGSHQWESDWEG